MAIISEPRHPHPLLRWGVRFAERTVGRRLEPARLLAWYPRAALSSGVMEALVAHREPSPRILALVRVAASLTAACPFCVDMNSFGAGEAGVTASELGALQAAAESGLTTLTPRERAVVRYARAVSGTPVIITADLIEEVTRLFSPREVVVLATTAAQVNYWARTIQALGIQPAGFCTLPTGTQGAGTGVRRGHRVTTA